MDRRGYSKYFIYRVELIEHKKKVKIIQMHVSVINLNTKLLHVDVILVMFLSINKESVSFITCVWINIYINNVFNNWTSILID